VSDAFVDWAKAMQQYAREKRASSDLYNLMVSSFKDLASIEL
jgi:hypothetical protein